MSFYTPLRYPGGKGKLATYVKGILVENDLLGGHYVEVYAGGAGVAMELLLEDYVQSIHINDLNLQVYSFWHSVINETDALCGRIQDTAVSMEEWQRQKDVYSRPARDVSYLDRAFATFFLNRTNRSGILKAGVIGGKNQDGPWKLDARFSKNDLVNRITAIAKRKRNIKLTRKDALKFVTDDIPQRLQNTLVYLDPPYYVKGAGLYDNFYSHADHSAIAMAVRNLKKTNWIVSYDDAPEIRELYNGIPVVTYNLSYSAANRYRGSEVMYFSPGLNIPVLEDYGYRCSQAA